jgi:adenylate cyclase
MAERTRQQSVVIERHDTPDVHVSDWLADAFRTEALEGLKVSTWGRLASLVVIAGLLVYLTPIPGLYYYEALLVLFAGLGIVHYLLRRQHFEWPWLSYVFIALDFALLTFTLFVPNPLAIEPRPPQMALRNDPIVYYFLLIAAVAFSYSPSLMVWAGIAAAVSWSGGVLWLLSLPDTLTKFDHPPEMTITQHIAEHLEARFVDTDVWVQNLVLLLLVAGVLAFMVQRSRRLVVRQARAARQRANLSRYFSPNVLDEVAGTDGPLTAVRKHEVAVLFADIVGFTRLCETMAPENVMELLREYHARLEEEVFRFGGTLDKFIGDAVMASFGAPRSGLQDATSALRCARAMLRSLAQWNSERATVGAAPIRIGIGLHYGPAVMGDVGSARCAAFAVIGDTTNTTSRLQSLTRTLETDVVVSQALMVAIRREISDADNELAGLVDAGLQTIRGRENTLHVWTLTFSSIS